jgi:hypothetical protein
MLENILKENNKSHKGGGLAQLVALTPADLKV